MHTVFGAIGAAFLGLLCGAVLGIIRSISRSSRKQPRREQQIIETPQQAQQPKTPRLQLVRRGGERPAA